jgi:bifunctional non-homologous end joining protein LigD
MPRLPSNAELLAELRRAPLPQKPPLMLCGLVDQAFDRKGWIFEPKLDGLRVLCISRDGKNWNLLSRNDKPQNAMFPEIVAGLQKNQKKSATPMILDGEIVCLDEHGEPSFRRLQQRFHLTDPHVVAQRMKSYPTHLYVFDILYFDRFDLRNLTLAARKVLLQRSLNWKNPIRFTPATPEHGKAMLTDACKHGREGIVAKRLDSHYTGDRSGAWLKIKCSGRQEFVIGGFTDPRGARIGLGAILVGYFAEDRKTFHYAGKVGTGFNSKMLIDLRRQLDKIPAKTNPFAHHGRSYGGPRGSDVHFVKPKFVCEIGFAEWTQNNLLRQPRFEGLRPDKNATAVRRERARTFKAKNDRHR